MPACQVVVEVEDAPGARANLAHAWVYWKQGGSTTLLRSNASGLLMSAGDSGDATRPSNYARPFNTTSGSTVDLHYSLGDKPTPQARLAENDDAFVQRTVNLPAAGQAPRATVEVAPNRPNTVVVVPRAIIRIPRAEVAVARPAELSLWSLLW